MKRLIMSFVCAITLLGTSCDKKGSSEPVNRIPNISGNYTCSFTIPKWKRISQTITIDKDGKVYGDFPFEQVTFINTSLDDSNYTYRFNIPQIDFEENGKTYFFTLNAELEYKGGGFNVLICLAAYGEKEVSGDWWEIQDFTLINNY